MENYRIPNFFLCDFVGTSVASGVMKELNKYWGSNTNYLKTTTTATDGQTREDELGVGAIFEEVCGLQQTIGRSGWTMAEFLI